MKRVHRRPASELEKTNGEVPEWSNGPDRQTALPFGRTQCARRARSEATSQIRCTGVRRTPASELEKTNGEVPEWSNGPDSKSGVRLYRTVGSNPTLSARQIKMGPSGPFLFGLPSVVAGENPVRQAQRRSRMPGREATIPPSPPTTGIICLYNSRKKCGVRQWHRPAGVMPQKGPEP